MGLMRGHRGVPYNAHLWEEQHTLMSPSTYSWVVCLIALSASLDTNCALMLCVESATELAVGKRLPTTLLVLLASSPCRSGAFQTVTYPLMSRHNVNKGEVRRVVETAIFMEVTVNAGALPGEEARIRRCCIV